mmetsp:Transcript_2825/g.8532  ORF Transcript_2825/g.8532 Transcript_2825/m.8532 type:complete len:183 (-) Transcript_2825:149-697(-)
MMTRRLLVLAVSAAAFQRPAAPRRPPQLAAASQAAAEAAAAIAQAVDAFGAATTATDAGLAMAKIYDALPRDDLSLDAVGGDTGFLSSEDQLAAFRALAARRGENGLWTPDNVASFKALRAALDPLHVTDLQGYLSFAGLLGGALYVAALWVQQTLPEIFPAVYVFLATCFAAPIAFAYFVA